MKVAVICSNGKVGKLVVVEALASGFDVTGFARSENKSGAKNFVQKDIFALTKDDLSGFDFVVDAFGAWAKEDLPNHGKSLDHLCALLSGSKTRLVIIGALVFQNPVERNKSAVPKTKKQNLSCNSFQHLKIYCEIPKQVRK